MVQDTNMSAAAPGSGVDRLRQPADMRLVAKNYRERVWAPIPLGPKSKRPVSKDWTQQVVDDNTQWPGNIGVRLGEPSAGLVDIDLDSEEARVLAPCVLPPTDMIFGRPSSRDAHWLYDCGESAPASASTGARFSPGDAEKEGQKPLVELRSTGGQTMFPPSIHPTGEQLSWVRYEQPGKVDPAELTRAVEILAAASLLLRNFPEKGARFNAYAAMTGTMLRCDVPEETISRIIAVFTERFGSPPRAREQSVKALSRRLATRDGSVPGFPRLAEVFGKEVAQRCREWLESDADWKRSGKGMILAGALHNMRLAMRRLDVRFRYNEFADQMLVTVGDGNEENLEDQIVNRLWFLVEEKFGFSPPQERFRTFLSDAACQNRFHPVRDYLDRLEWDGTKRIDTWLFDYAGISRREDDNYNRYVEAVGHIMLVAGVRRIRQPGCKFDEMLVLISETQGTAKSTSLSILARRSEWFTDSVDLGMKDKEVIEQMRGKWIAEVPELRGRKREVDHIKAFLSRQHDRARLAYGHFRTEVGRSFVLFGTANDVRFLLDSTGNRRFWPIVGAKFDTETLERGVDQLWAEAAAAEAAGESIRLPNELWGAAEAVQADSQVDDPWIDVLRTALGDFQGKIRAVDVWKILEIEAARRNQYDNERMGAAMRQLGWKRAENPIRFESGTARGYTRGDDTEEIVVWRNPDEARHVNVRIGHPPTVRDTRMIIDGHLCVEDRF